MTGGLWVFAVGLLALLLIVRFQLSNPTVEWEEHEELDALERMWEES